jgi:hypothetical protein
MKKRKIAYIRWSDASNQAGSITEDEINPRVEVESVGMLIRQDKDTVSIGLDYYPHDETWRWVLNIPRVNIISMVVFKRPSRKSKPLPPTHDMTTP